MEDAATTPILKLRDPSLSIFQWAILKCGFTQKLFGHTHALASNADGMLALKRLFKVNTLPALELDCARRTKKFFVLKRTLKSEKKSESLVTS